MTYGTFESPLKSGDKKLLRLSVLSYSDQSAEEVFGLIQESGMRSLLEVHQGSLSLAQERECDVAIAVFGPGEDIKRFAHDATALKVVDRIPAVFGVVLHEALVEVADHINEIGCDELLYLPLDPTDFGRRIMTRIVAVKIEREKSMKQIDYSRSQRSFGEILVEHAIITPMQLKKALDFQKINNMRLGEALVDLGYISEEQKLQFLASQIGVEIATSKMYASADLNIVGSIPEHIARRFNCIALDKKDDVLWVAMEDVLNLRLLDTLRDLTEMTIKPLLAAHEDINTSLDRFYRDIASQKDVSELVKDLEDEDVEFVKQDNEDINVEDAAAAGAELGIVRIVNMLIANAVRDRASDIHIEAMERELVVRYRIDGELRRVMSPPRKSHQAMIARIKILSNLDIAERRLPQDGRMVVKVGKRQIDIRVSILPTLFGEKAVLRILDKEAFDKSITNLGFGMKEVAVFRKAISSPYGMIIVTGPTGSGKSTTLYSAIQSIKSVMKNIVTVEDPVEFHIDGINQVHVNSKIGLDFAASLRSILRQDPDVILIGEIRDHETADIAIKMALTGHLVFSTLHTNDAAGAIARFVDIGVPPLLLGSSLNLIISQRLVRCICPKCKEEYAPQSEVLDRLHLGASQVKKFYRGKGCVNCKGSGYFGRTGLFEMMPITKDVRSMIIRNAPTTEIQEQAVKDGMSTLRNAGIQKVIAGETTIEQVIAVTTDIE